MLPPPPEPLLPPPPELPPLPLPSTVSRNSPSFCFAVPRGVYVSSAPVAKSLISPAVTDCNPAESERIPVTIPLDFLTASIATINITTLPTTLITVPSCTRTSLSDITIGINNSNNFIPIIEANTPKLCTINAILHCFALAPSSSGSAANIGGDIIYSIKRLNILAPQLNIHTARSYNTLNPTTNIII